MIKIMKNRLHGNLLINFPYFIELFHPINFDINFIIYINFCLNLNNLKRNNNIAFNNF